MIYTQIYVFIDSYVSISILIFFSSHFSLDESTVAMIKSGSVSRDSRSSRRGGRGAPVTVTAAGRSQIVLGGGESEEIKVHFSCK
jgi:hypothetical protein